MTGPVNDRTVRNVRPMSALPPKADIREGNHDVRFVPKADIGRLTEHGY
jgi:hypothetical protein